MPRVLEGKSDWPWVRAFLKSYPVKIRVANHSESSVLIVCVENYLVALFKMTCLRMGWRNIYIIAVKTVLGINQIKSLRSALS